MCERGVGPSEGREYRVILYQDGVHVHSRWMRRKSAMMLLRALRKRRLVGVDPPGLESRKRGDGTILDSTMLTDRGE